MKTSIPHFLFLGFFTLPQVLGFLFFWTGVAAVVVRVALAVFTGPVKFVRLKRGLMTALKWSGVGLVLVFLAAWYGLFQQAEYQELPNPVVPANRLFARQVGFSDISVNLYASDWPHTFLRPFMVGNGCWPEAYAENRFLWSKDGSVIAWQVRRHESPAATYGVAYDYLKHEPLDRHHTDETAVELNLRIRKLLEERGGVGEQVTVPDMK